MKTIYVGTLPMGIENSFVAVFFARYSIFLEHRRLSKMIITSIHIQLITNCAVLSTVNLFDTVAVVWVLSILMPLRDTQERKENDQNTLV